MYRSDALRTLLLSSRLSSLSFMSAVIHSMVHVILVRQSCLSEAEADRASRGAVEVI